jgi:phenylacetate-coenzyme A ligase PaaK-like adenylate-forming protein
MLLTAFDQLRYALSILWGVPFSTRSLDRLIDALLATQHEFGGISAVGDELLGGPALDEETRRAIQERRFRAQAVHAARETTYYRTLFDRLSLEPQRIETSQLHQIPLTTKAVVGAAPGAFVRRSAQPCFRASTTGTTGWPTSIFFSARELHTFIALSALGNLHQRRIAPDDVVQISTSTRATLGNACFAAACARIGALVSLAGVVEPAHTLALLAQQQHLPGKKGRVSVLMTYPSYLGELVEWGRRHGYRPADFGLERIVVGGEIVTEGLKARCEQLFGPVSFDEGYGMTETWPVSGQRCSAGHLHWEASQALVEVYDDRTNAPAAPSAAGSLVVTPFAPYRETTLLLRYDTEDMVRPIAGPLSCELRNQPATTNLLGKRRLSTRHDDGWTFPREVLEALEAVEDVPLPARCGFWATDDGVAVEVVVRSDDLRVRHAVERSLEAHGVPLRELHLLTDRRELRRPLPLRGDLRESSFSPPTSESMLIPLPQGTINA